MADSPAFVWTCEELERCSDLNRIEARGTVRIALKEAGFESRGVQPDQMRVVIEKLLPAELSTRGIEGSDSICAQLAAGMDSLDVGDVADSPDEIFRRLSGA